MFYTFRQNNSGGSFYGPALYVIVEAGSPEEANSRAKGVAELYFNGVDSGQDCSCCGDRWYPAWENGNKVPSIYDTPITKLSETDFTDWGDIDFVKVFYLNGKVETIKRKPKPKFPCQHVDAYYKVCGLGKESYRHVDKASQATDYRHLFVAKKKKIKKVKKTKKINKKK